MGNGEVETERMPLEQSRMPDGVIIYICTKATGPLLPPPFSPLPLLHPDEQRPGQRPTL